MHHVYTLKEADYLREEGNGHFKDGEYTAAIKKYKSAASKYKELSLVKWEAKTVSNISLCFLKLNNPDGALEFAEMSIQLDSGNPKVSEPVRWNVDSSRIK